VKNRLKQIYARSAAIVARNRTLSIAITGVVLIAVASSVAHAANQPTTAIKSAPVFVVRAKQVKSQPTKEEANKGDGKQLNNPAATTAEKKPVPAPTSSTRSATSPSPTPTPPRLKPLPVQPADDFFPRVQTGTNAYPADTGNYKRVPFAVVKTGNYAGNFTAACKPTGGPVELPAATSCGAYITDQFYATGEIALYIPPGSPFGSYTFILTVNDGTRTKTAIFTAVYDTNGVHV